jgi:Flp pilus assembly protein TadD
MLRGAALSALRRWTEAVEALEEALRVAGPSPDVLNALGAAQLGAGRPADAVRALEQSLSLQPNQPAARTVLEQARKR